MKMNRYELELLQVITEKVYFNLLYGADKESLINEINDVIYNLPLTCSTDLLNSLYKLIEIIETGYELINESLINQF